LTANGTERQRKILRVLITKPSKEKVRTTYDNKPIIPNPINENDVKTKTNEMSKDQVYGLTCAAPKVVW